MINIDALRDFSPGPDLPPKIEVRRAGRRDLEVLMSLETKLKRHLSLSFFVKLDLFFLFILATPFIDPSGTFAALA
ncbi:MAG TPA: hypothetical protein EYN72_06575 [Dehalococcoidia bacterium]|nr:hypothetical protein [Dehalococcoidia bacterium]